MHHRTRLAQAGYLEPGLAGTIREPMSPRPAARKASLLLARGCAEFWRRHNAARQCRLDKDGSTSRLRLAQRLGNSYAPACLWLYALANAGHAYPLVTGLPRAQEYPAHAAVHRVGADALLALTIHGTSQKMPDFRGDRPAWLSRRRVEDLSADEAPAKTPILVSTRCREGTNCRLATTPSAPCAQQSGRRVNRRAPLALRQAAGCASGSERCSSLAPNRAARAPPRACRSACLRWSSP